MHSCTHSRPHTCGTCRPTLRARRVGILGVLAGRGSFLQPPTLPPARSFWPVCGEDPGVGARRFGPQDRRARPLLPRAGAEPEPGSRPLSPHPLVLAGQQTQGLSGRRGDFPSSERATCDQRMGGLGVPNRALPDTWLSARKVRIPDQQGSGRTAPEQLVGGGRLGAGLCAAASKGWCPWPRQRCGGNTEGGDPSFLRVHPLLPPPSELGGAGVGRLQETGVEGALRHQDPPGGEQLSGGPGGCRFEGTRLLKNGYFRILSPGLFVSPGKILSGGPWGAMGRLVPGPGERRVRASAGGSACPGPGLTAPPPRGQPSAGPCWTRLLAGLSVLEKPKPFLAEVPCCAPGPGSRGQGGRHGWGGGQDRS